MKKGFTLIELIGVIVLLGALLLIIVPLVSKSLKDGKEKVLEGQITNIEQSLSTWAINYKPKSNETIKITLSQLKQAGLVEYDLKNPITEEYFANDMVLTVTNIDGIISYDVLSDTGNCTDDYTDIPKIDIVGDVVEYVEINSTYTDIIATSSVEVVSSGEVDTTSVGSYHITYTAKNGGRCNSSIKTIIVRDTTGPSIEFENADLEINLSEVDTYDFLSDVTVSDNSNLDTTIEVETNFSALKGNYSIKYIASDIYGNITTRFRKVTVK